ncbi:sulfatase-like hydrolase/transferase [Halomicroarcula sp. GCM10025324]|uniref:sulfatase-like hydrolase/transferase n=1 Tax=Haloarcula TaxID=2237 RepID=UPI0023E7D4FD|nr:sulfatase-like hydrolase/transferase [Halomicroarcula sp. ZS-22-S1]
MQSATSTASNVVLVTIDSLRADAIGNENGVSPVLDGLADEGVVFDGALAQGNWTPFSFPSILGSRPVFAERPDIGLASTPSLAERLSEAGFATAGFNAANGFLTDPWGYDRGFDKFEPFVDSAGYSKYLAAHPTVQAWVQLATSPFRRAATFLRGGSDARPFADISRMGDLEDHAVRFLQETEDGFFLWVHYMDTHTPYVPAPRHLREVADTRLNLFRMLSSHVRTGLGWDVDERTLETLETLYAATVRQVDASVGRILETLDDEGFADETAIVVAGDHGEEFLEHGHLAHYPKLYRELIDVPLFVSHPDGTGGTVSQPVGLDAIPPTVCALLGVEPAAEWEGPVLPLSPDADFEDQSPVVSAAVRGESVTSQPIPRRLDDGELLLSARDERWTYIEHTDTGRYELYDREADPDEQRDLRAETTAERPPAPVVDRLSRAVAEHADRLLEGDDGTAEDGDGGQASDEITARLRALGYQ